MKVSKFFAAGAVALALVSGPALADQLQIRISDGTNTYTAADNNASGTCTTDTNATVGFMSLSCQTGDTVWNIGVNGLQVADGSVDLNSLVASSSSGGTITLWLTARINDFVTPGPVGAVSLEGAIGGTMNSVGTTAWYLMMDDITYFAEQQLLDSDSFTYNSSGSTFQFFGGQLAGQGVTTDGVWAPLLKVVITHAGAGSTSFDFNAGEVVPEPGLLSLLGLGLAGLGFFARRRVR